MENTPSNVQEIKTRDGKLITKIVTDSETGVMSAYDDLGTIRARYDPRENITYDHLERAVSRGNSIIAIACNCFPMAAANSTPPG